MTDAKASRHFVGAERVLADAAYELYNFQREEHFDQLAEVVDDPAAPSIALLSGPRGIGRKYLVRAFGERRRHSSKRLLVFEVDLEGFEPTQDESVTEFLEYRMKNQEDASKQHRSKLLKLVPQVLGGVGALTGGTAAVLAGLSQLILSGKEISELLGSQDADFTLPAMDERTRFQQFFERLASHGPVIVLASYASLDSKLLRWLLELAEGPLPVFLALTVHPLDSREGLSAGWAYREIHLKALTEQEVAGLLDLRFEDHRFPPEVAKLLWRATGGLPASLAAQTRHLVRKRGFVSHENGSWSLPPEGLEAPAFAQALGPVLWEPVSQRVDSLPADEAKLLREFLFDAALCGELLLPEILHKVRLEARGEKVGIGQEKLVDLVTGVLVGELDLLVELDFAEHPGLPREVGAAYQFRNPAFSAVVRTQMADNARERRAKRIIGWLEKKLPVKSRFIAELYLSLSEHLGQEERDSYRQELSWWVSEIEALELKEELLWQVEEGALNPEKLWERSKPHPIRWMPPARTLAILDAYEQQGDGVPEERLGEFHLRRGIFLRDAGKYAEALVETQKGHALLEERIGQTAPLTLNALLVLGGIERSLGLWEESRQTLEQGIFLHGQELSELLLAFHHSLAGVLVAQGKLTAARSKYEEVLEIRDRHLGPGHPATMATRQKLAEVLDQQGYWSEARSEYEAVLELEERRLGSEHPSTLGTRHALARVLEQQGELTRARSEYESILEVKSHQSGPEHPDTLTARATLAGVLEKQGHLSEARSEYEEVLALEIRQLGPEHPGTLTTRHNLAGVLLDQGHLFEARSEYEEVLALVERHFGSEHQQTLAARYQLARVLQKQGELTQAQSGYEAVLELAKSHLGPEHPLTLNIRHQLAQVLGDQGHLSEARSELEELLALEIRQLGPEHSTTWTVRATLAGVLEKQGHLSEARSEYEEVLALEIRQLGPEHPGTLTTRHTLAGVLLEQGHLFEARSEYEEVLALVERHFGSEHQQTLAARYQLARVLQEQGELIQAKSEYEAVLERAKGHLGPEHPLTLTVRHQLAQVLGDQGHLSEARAEYEEVLGLAKSHLGPEHPLTLCIRHNLAGVLRDQGHLSEARSELKVVFELTKHHLGPEHPRTLATRHQLAVILEKEGELARARSELRKLLAPLVRQMGSEHPHTLTIHHSLARVLEKQGQLEDARKHLKIALSGRKKILGTDHPDTQASRQLLEDLAAKS